jgi:hypothetical protein
MDIMPMIAVYFLASTLALLGLTARGPGRE